MAKKTAKLKSGNGQQKLNAKPDLESAGQPGVASGASAAREAQADYWGDRFAFRFWLTCFALMALMVGFDVIRGLWRWMGGQ